MYFDLNVPYTANHGELQRTLAFLSESQSFRCLRQKDADLEKWAITLLH